MTVGSMTLTTLSRHRRHRPAKYLLQRHCMRIGSILHCVLHIGSTLHCVLCCMHCSTAVCCVLVLCAV